VISSRFAPALTLLLCLALIPTVIHSYRGMVIDDGLTLTAVPETLEGMPSVPTERRARWVDTNFAAKDWFERTYTVGNEQVGLFAARSYDPKRLYHHPEIALLKSGGPRPAGRSTLPGRPDVPVHLLTISRGARKGIIAYALLYEGSYIEKPILFQLRTSADLLVSGRKPTTLFLAHDFAGSPDRLAEAPAIAVLGAAIRAFEASAARKP
jgi:hypothetical protein